MRTVVDYRGDRAVAETMTFVNAVIEAPVDSV